MANADCIVIQGSNMAENHPVAYQWVTEAKMRGAKILHIDPRFTRTSAVADKHVPIRVGTDIVFLGALIKYVLDNDLYFEEYVKAFTNAATLVDEDFKDVDELDGVFSGYDPETGAYDMRSWAYDSPSTREDEVGGPDDGHEHGSEKRERSAGDEHGSGGPALDHAVVLRDDTLQHPRCVFQVVKRHFARYTPKLVEEMCGVSREDFLEVARTITENSGRERTTCFAYAVGWTQHTLGAQFIRTASILQLLLGNIGRPGGGIMALRGHASIQGSTDIPTLFNLLPGYLPMPKAGTHDTFDHYIASIASPDQKGYWADARKYAVSLLKAYYGDAATPENDFGFDMLPRLTGNHNTYATAMGMIDGTVEGYFLLGQNPAVGSSHGRLQRHAMSNLKWLVVRDMNLIESATFWKSGPEVVSGETKTEDIGTEVFFLPAASYAEKSGTFTQTQRLLQWREAAVAPPGEASSELDFFYELGNVIRRKLAGSTDPRDRAILDLTWDYRRDAKGEIDAEAVLAEINGRHLTGEKAGQLLSSYLEMKDDGSTDGGCWIYCGVFKDGVNQAHRRKPDREQSWVSPEWGWAWPANRRILYNRASADPQGRPWSERKAYVWWDEEKGEWTGHDIPDFPAKTRPDHRPEPGTGGAAGLAGDDPFIMQADGKGWLYAPKGMVDGPMPSHYEAQESPVTNPLYSQQRNPSRMVYPRKDNLSAPSGTERGADVYPFVMTTYRLTEHHTAGGMSRWLPYLSELQPEFFCEVSPELAKIRGLENGGWATIISPRSAIEARVLVTDRVRPMRIGEQTIHQIGLPYHWGQGGDGAVVTGDGANDLLGVTLDPNVAIQESKVASCDIRPGRRPTGDALVHLVQEYASLAGITADTGNVHRAPDAVPQGSETDDDGGDTDDASAGSYPLKGRD